MMNPIGCPAPTIPKALLRFGPGGKCATKIEIPEGELAADPRPTREMHSMNVTLLRLNAATRLLEVRDVNSKNRTSTPSILPDTHPECSDHK